MILGLKGNKRDEDNNEEYKAIHKIPHLPEQMNSKARVAAIKKNSAAKVFFLPNLSMPHIVKKRPENKCTPLSLSYCQKWKINKVIITTVGVLRTQPKTRDLKTGHWASTTTTTAKATSTHDEVALWFFVGLLHSRYESNATQLYFINAVISFKWLPSRVPEYISCQFKKQGEISKRVTRRSQELTFPFIAGGEQLSGWWGIRMSGVNNKKFVIDFRSSQVRQAHSCIR